MTASVHLVERSAPLAERSAPLAGRRAFGVTFNDVAVAVMQGADYVMLSGETAAGRHPVRAAREMASIIATVEQHLRMSC